MAETKSIQEAQNAFEESFFELRELLNAFREVADGMSDGDSKPWPSWFWTIDLHARRLHEASEVYFEAVHRHRMLVVSDLSSPGDLS
jgi:hypothetical protein